MATMKSKLEGKVEVVRKNVKEIKLIKAIANEALREGVGATMCMARLYDAVLNCRRLYGSEEIRRFVDVALHEAEKTLKELEKLVKKLESKMDKKENKKEVKG